jgi:protoporphyrinogen oxidase
VVQGPGWDGLRAVTVCSRKFPDRCPDRWELVRAFFAAGPEARDRDDATWIERSRRIVGRALGVEIGAGPAWVARWWNAIPRYGPRHAGTVSAWREAAGSLGRVALAGAGFDAAGIDGAVRSGLAAARAIAGVAFA